MKNFGMGVQNAIWQGSMKQAKAEHDPFENIPVSPHVAREIRQLADLLGERPGTSVLLLGSTARGELAEGIVDGHREVFSDYEFFVVTPRQLSRTEQQRLRQAAQARAREFGYRNPLFHVDVAFRERGRLGRLPRTIFTFELKCNARVISGQDLRGLIPEVNLDNLNWRDTHEILYRRLWAILMAMPEEFVHGKTDKLSEVTMSYLLARNVLDLTTVLLPYQGVLLPTYRQRVAYWREHGLGRAFVAALGSSLVSFLERCLEERQTLTFSEPARDRYPQVIEYLTRALVLVGLNLESPETAPSPFNEWPWTRGQWVQWARVVKRLIPQWGARRTIRWLVQPRKAMRAVGHLEAHRALIAWQQGDVKTAEEALLRSWYWLLRLMPETENIPTSAEPFLERWLALRRYWYDYWCKYLVL